MAISTFLRDNKTGKLVFNGARRFVVPEILTVDGFPSTKELDDDNGVIAAKGVFVGAGKVVGGVPATVKQDGPFEAFYLTHRRVMATSGDAAAVGDPDCEGVLVKITDVGARNTLMNDWIHCDLIMGNAAMPFVLPETLMLEELRSVLWEFKSINASTKGIWMYPAMVGRKYLRGRATPVGILDSYISNILRRQQVSIPFFYTFDNLGADGTIALAAGTLNQSFFITLASDAAFDWWKFSLLATTPAQLSFRIRDPETGREFMNSTIFAPMACSIGKIGTDNSWSSLYVPGGTAIANPGFLSGLTPAMAPAIWPEPLFCGRNQKLEVIFDNYDTEINYIYAALSGRKVFAIEGMP